MEVTGVLHVNNCMCDPCRPSPVTVQGMQPSPQPGTTPLRLPSPGGMGRGRGAHCCVGKGFFQPDRTRTAGVRRKEIRYAVVALPVILCDNWEHGLCHCNKLFPCFFRSNNKVFYVRLGLCKHTANYTQKHGFLLNKHWYSNK